MRGAFRKWPCISRIPLTRRAYRKSTTGPPAVAFTTLSTPLLTRLSVTPLLTPATLHTSPFRVTRSALLAIRPTSAGAYVYTGAPDRKDELDVPKVLQLYMQVIAPLNGALRAKFR